LFQAQYFHDQFLTLVQIMDGPGKFSRRGSPPPNRIPLPNKCPPANPYCVLNTHLSSTKQVVDMAERRPEEHCLAEPCRSTHHKFRAQEVRLSSSLECCRLLTSRLLILDDLFGVLDKEGVQPFKHKECPVTIPSRSNVEQD
jgi:hypothetical protein